MRRKSNTEYILSLSYGKDSIACLEAIKRLNYPLDRIIHAEVWATDTIPADLLPMVEFKSYADKVIKKRYGIDVEHICAVRGGKKLTYEVQFYELFNSGRNKNKIYGFPYTSGAWCNGRLKVRALSKIRENTIAKGAKKKIVQYLGIAADEPERIKRHSASEKILPLVDIGWDESYCRKWCEENDLLSPIYTTATRGGCWFCHNQRVDQLRLLRKDYPDLWQLLLKWDKDSPTTFKSDGRTVQDFDKRFQAEDDGLIKAGDKKFRWKNILKDKE